MRMIAGTTWGVEDARRYIDERVMIVPWSGCWLWELSLVDGYGGAVVPTRKAEGARHRKAHRLSYEAFVGPIPDGLLVCHKCDVRACCNPDHFFLGTKFDNASDMIAKGRKAPCHGELNGYAKMDAAKVREVRERLRAGETQCAIADDMGFHQTTVSDIKRGRTWSHVVDV